MTTGLVYDPRFLDHRALQPGRRGGHPERPERLEAVLARLQASFLWPQLHLIPAQPAPFTAVAAVHDETYLSHLEKACAVGASTLDNDTYINASSYQVAMLAAGGVLAAVDVGMQGHMPAGAGGGASAVIRNAFCAVRPPGHHAERDRAMGFCLLNHVAIAAQHLIDQHHLERIAIVDFDVHHGNGTQHIFEERADVLFISLHEHPRSLYPGSGFVHERGSGPGEGFTLNLPLDPGSGDREYRLAFLKYVLPALDAYRPQFLLLSAGFDASRYDPLAHMKVTTDGFQWMTRQLKMAAERHCQGRLVSVLEGGYELRSLAENVELHVGQLLQPEGHDDMMAMKAGL